MLHVQLSYTYYFNLLSFSIAATPCLSAISTIICLIPQRKSHAKHQNYSELENKCKVLANGLASRRKFLTWLSTCVSFGHPLASTLVELKFVRKSKQIFHRLATQCKSTQVDRESSVCAWNLRLFATCVSLRADLRIRLATHHKSMRKFWFCKLASTCESVWSAGEPFFEI